MTTYTHDQLVAAVEAAGRWVACPEAQLVTLAALLEIHHDIAPIYLGRGPTCACDDDWPCPTVEVVVDALTRMGALQ